MEKSYFMSELITERLEIPMEHCLNIFGQCDKYIKKIERAYSVDIINRDDSISIRGSRRSATQVKEILTTLKTLSERGNVILEQDVDYAIAMGMEENEDALLQIDKEVICLAHFNRICNFLPQIESAFGCNNKIFAHT